MSTPSPSPARPARLAAFVLLGVAVIAVGLGIYTLTSGGSGTSSAAQTPTPTSQPGRPPTSHPTTSTRPVPTTTTPAPTTGYPSGQTTTVIPPPPLTTGNGPGGAGQPAAPVMVRVYNNGTIKGLALCAEQDFQAAGFDVVQVGNYSQGIISTSTVYYSPTAPGEQQTAQQLGQQFGMRVDVRFPGIANASPGVIVIITNDFRGARCVGKG